MIVVVVVDVVVALSIPVDASHRCYRCHLITSHHISSHLRCQCAPASASTGTTITLPRYIHIHRHTRDPHNYTISCSTQTTPPPFHDLSLPSHIHNHIALITHQTYLTPPSHHHPLSLSVLVRTSSTCATSVRASVATIWTSCSDERRRDCDSSNNSNKNSESSRRNNSSVPLARSDLSISWK